MNTHKQIEAEKNNIIQLASIATPIATATNLMKIRWVRKMAIKDKATKKVKIHKPSEVVEIYNALVSGNNDVQSGVFIIEPMVIDNEIIDGFLVEEVPYQIFHACDKDNRNETIEPITVNDIPDFVGKDNISWMKFYTRKVGVRFIPIYRDALANKSRYGPIPSLYAKDTAQTIANLFSRTTSSIIFKSFSEEVMLPHFLKESDKVADIDLNPDKYHGYAPLLRSNHLYVYGADYVGEHSFRDTWAYIIALLSMRESKYFRLNAINYKLVYGIGEISSNPKRPNSKTFTVGLPDALESHRFEIDILYEGSEAHLWEEIGALYKMIVLSEETCEDTDLFTIYRQTQLKHLYKALNNILFLMRIKLSRNNTKYNGTAFKYWTELLTDPAGTLIKNNRIGDEVVIILLQGWVIAINEIVSQGTNITNSINVKQFQKVCSNVARYVKHKGELYDEFVILANIMKKQYGKYPDALDEDILAKIKNNIIILVLKIDLFEQGEQCNIKQYKLLENCHDIDKVIDLGVKFSHVRPTFELIIRN